MGAVLLVGALIAGVLVFLLRDADPNTVVTDGPTSQPTEAVAPRPTTTPTPSPTPSPTKRERVGRDEPTSTPDAPVVQRASSGSACEATSAESGWGPYPVGVCRTWKPATGLLTQSPLRPGTLRVTCQADLREENPVYTAGQTNTWWFWAQADNGTWDWFPETALAQGASDQSVNGVALCQ